MKKILSTLLVAACLLVAIPAQAQLKFGVKGGLNLSKLSVDEIKSKSYTGFFIGPMAELTIPVIGLGVDGALMYSQKGGKIEINDGSSETLKEQGIEIPLNLKYSIGLGSLASVYLAAGPSFFFNFADNDFDDLVDVDTKKAQIAINVGAGVKLIKHLQVGVNYNIPLTNSADLTVANAIDAVKTKTKTWQVSVAYIF